MDAVQILYEIEPINLALLAAARMICWGPQSSALVVEFLLS